MKISELYQLRNTVDDYNILCKVKYNVERETESSNAILDELFILNHNNLGIDLRIEIIGIIKELAIKRLTELINITKQKLIDAGIEVDEVE